MLAGFLVSAATSTHRSGLRDRTKKTKWYQHRVNRQLWSATHSIAHLETGYARQWYAVGLRTNMAPHPDTPANLGGIQALHVPEVSAFQMGTCTVPDFELNAARVTIGLSKRCFISQH